METDSPLSATERQAIDRRLERGRLEEEARQARLAKDANHGTSRHGELTFIHENCGQEFPNKRSLGQHTRYCTAPTLAQRLLPPPSEVPSAEKVIETIHELAQMPVEVSADLPEPPLVAREGTKIIGGVEHPVNKDGLTFIEVMGEVLPDLAKKREHLLAQEEGIRKALQANAAEIHDIEVALRVYEKIMKGDQ